MRIPNIYAVIAKNPAEYQGDIRGHFPLADSPDKALEIVEPNLPVSFRVTHCIEASLILPLLAAGKLDAAIPEHQRLAFRMGHLLATIERQKMQINQMGDMLKDSLEAHEYLQTLIDQLEAKAKP